MIKPLCILAIFFSSISVFAQDDENQKRENDDQPDIQQQDDQAKSKTPEPLQEYMGRRIAQTMHYLGAEWLIRDEREREERCSMMLANLGVRNGMTICDMGCGNGYHTLRMAEMTGRERDCVRSRCAVSNARLFTRTNGRSRHRKCDSYSG